MSIADGTQGHDGLLNLALRSHNTQNDLMVMNKLNGLKSDENVYMHDATM